MIQFNVRIQFREVVGGRREGRREGGKREGREVGRRKGRKEEGKEEGEKGGNDSREEKRFGNTDTHSNVLNMQSTTCMSTTSNSYPTSKEQRQTYCSITYALRSK